MAGNGHRPITRKPTSALLERVRRESGLSQASLARRAGLPRSVLNAYLRGGREPGGDTVARVAAAGGFELALAPRLPPVDPERAGRILVQVLELAEALPFRSQPELDYPNLKERVGQKASL